MTIRKIVKKDLAWLVKLMTQKWGLAKIVSRGKIYDVQKLPGYVAVEKNNYLGLIIYNIKNNECEIISLNSLKEGIGIGSALVKRAIEMAKEKKCQRVFIITTNNNLAGLRFYQKKGFTIKAVYKDAVEQSRKLKPEIPLVGSCGIAIKDEIELEMKL